MRYYLKPNDIEQQFDIIGYKPTQDALRCQGPVGEFIVSLVDNFREEMQAELVNEDGDVVTLNVFHRFLDEVKATIPADDKGWHWFRP